MGLRPCLGNGTPCPNLSAGPRCDSCRLAKQRARDTHRATPTQRGYDQAHRLRRQQWEPKVRAGVVDCARCHQPIRPGQAWDLDHDDDRTGYRGPSHADCNRRAGGAITPRNAQSHREG
jgi:hypothetical protein